MEHSCAIPSDVQLREVMFELIPNQPGRYRCRFFDGCKDKELIAVNGAINLVAHLKSKLFLSIPISNILELMTLLQAKPIKAISRNITKKLIVIKFRLRRRIQNRMPNLRRRSQLSLIKNIAQNQSMCMDGLIGLFQKIGS